MPEGPEIRRMADQLGGVLAGQRIAEAFFAFDKLSPYAKQLLGQLVERVYPQGKALLIQFDGGVSLYTHNQLYGRWYIVPRGVLPGTTRQLRLGLHTQSHSCLLYSASEIQMLDTRRIQEHPFLQGLGPDVLAPETGLAALIKRFSDPAFKRRRVGALLLDQRFVCGLGNYLRSEILYAAGLHPLVRTGSLGEPAVDNLARATQQVARRAYRHGGITNNLQRYRGLRRKGVSHEDARFQVFGRDGYPCYRCGSSVQRVQIAGRRLFMCPECQRTG